MLKIFFGYEKDENGEDLTILSYTLSGTKEDITSGKRIYKFIMLWYWTRI